MTDSSFVKQVSYNWFKTEENPILAGKQNKFNELEDQCSYIRESRKSCDFCPRSASFQCSEQETNGWTHFGPHLLKNLKIGFDFKTHKPLEDLRMRKEDPLKPAKKNGVNINIIKKCISNEEVRPFCKELLKAVQRDPKTKVRPSRTHNSMVQKVADSRSFEWSNQMHTTYFSFNGAASPRPQQDILSSIVSQTQNRRTGVQPNEAAKQRFRRLDLSFDQIMGLECLGVDISRFLPRADVSLKQDARIPPSFEVDGAACYWCVSPQHVAYGVAFILKEDARVVGVALQRNKSSFKVSVIQIATADVILLISINSNKLQAPKALNILFRDSQIFKVGVQIEKSLRALWEELQIESNSYVDLAELLQFSNKKFGSVFGVSESPLELHAIATALGYQDWGTQELIFSSWESRPLSSNQVLYAARNALVSILIFWSIASGRPVTKPLLSDQQVNVEQFVESVCIRGPLSKRYQNIHLMTHGLGLGFGEFSSANQS